MIAQHTRCPFRSLSCSTAGVQDIRTVAEQAENEYRLRHVPTILFMDEIHRFNKKQQDVFLPYVETGKLILLGATTENPTFSINSVRSSSSSHLGAPLSLPSDPAAAAGAGGRQADPATRADARRVHPGERSCDDDLSSL